MDHYLEIVMSSLLKTPPSVPDPEPAHLDELFAGIELIEDDGEPMESDWHVKTMLLLMSSIDQHFRDREDYYVGGNMFIYFSAQQARNNDFRGPDFYFVWNTMRQPLRKYWAVWLEHGRTPDVVIELCSPSTRKEDHGTKKKIYEATLHVSDYFCYDPEKGLLEGWILKNKKYVPLKPNAEGRLWSEELGLWVGPWHGKLGRFTDTWLRFFDKQGKLVLNEDEASSLRADEAERNAETAQRHADEADKRLKTVEAEAEALRAKLASLEAKNGSAKNGTGKKKK